MDDVVKIAINTEVEAYPVLVIQEDVGPPVTAGLSNVEVPRAMVDRLCAAHEEAAAAELEIMRYVAERYELPDVRAWLADYEPF